MKRFFFWFFILLGMFILFFFGLNLFDSRPKPDLVGPIFPDGDKFPGGNKLFAVHLETGNGFFLIWGFAEDADVDLLAPAFRAQVLELFSAPRKIYLLRSRYGQWLTRLNANFRQNWQRANLYFPKRLGEDVCSYFASRRAQIMEQQQRFDLPLRRYRQVLSAADLEDFTPLGWEFPASSLLLATYTVKLFVASRTLAALDGQWLQTGNDLLEAMAAGFKLISTGRTITVNSLGKTMIELSLRALASLLNRPDCPKAFVQLILEHLPARPTGEFGTGTVRAFTCLSFAEVLARVKRDKVVDPLLLKDYFHDPAAFFALERFVAISGLRIFVVVHALATFFLKENETAAAACAFWESVGRLEETPPWQWGSRSGAAFFRGSDAVQGPFWWLRNPMGKMMVRSAVPYLWPVLRNYVSRSLELKIRYDLLRLLVRIRLEKISTNAGEAGPIHTLLAAAERDPYSGQPYRFNNDLGVIYSIGPDFEDNGGREQPLSANASDITVAVKFVIGD